MITTWLDQPSTTRGISFAQSEGWTRVTYDELARRTRGLASLIAMDAPSGSVVAIVGAEGSDFVEAFYGVLHAGCTPTALARPGPFMPRGDYVEHVGRILAVAQPALVITTPDCRSHIEEALEHVGIAAPVLEPGAAHTGDIAAQPQAPLAFLQFTSGSSGSPRAVRIGWDNLEANVMAIQAWVGMTPETPLATWLPVFHDMGLIGCLISPVAAQADIWMMTPEQFVRNPLRWLECFGFHGAAITGSPSFGYAHLARAVARANLDGMDFSRWQAAVVGADRVDPAPLGQLAHALRSHGFDAGAIRPAYGLAEVTLAATGTPLRAVPVCVRPDWASLRTGEPVSIEATAMLGDDAIGSGSGWLTGCGVALDGLSITIVDDDGSALPDSHLGEIVVRGTSVGDGYVGARADAMTRFVGDSVATGDAGFLHNGELFVVGRIGDSVKVKGRTIYAEDLEAKVVADVGISARRCAVIPGLGETAAVLVVIESSTDVGDQVVDVLERELGYDHPVEIVSVPKGTIPRTSSGKVRRRLLWQLLADHALGEPTSVS